ncbi:MAG: ATP-binding protein [Acidimicrobiales bacterium]
MTLRARVALLVAGVVTAVVAIVGVSAVRTADRELRQEIDDDLLERASAVQGDRRFGEGRFPGLGPGRPGAPPVARRPGPPRIDAFGLFVQFDVLARVVDADGRVLLTLDDEIGAAPDPEVLAEAAGSGPRLATVSGAAGDLRLLTVQAAPGVFVQLARPLAEVDEALSDLRERVVLLGAAAVLVAALAAWVLAGRAVRPIVGLTDTVEEIATTGDIERPVDGSGPGEVGRLATSFRSMLDALVASRQQQHRLVMDASHEMRTPLTSLRTNVDVLRRMDSLGDDDRRMLLGDIDAELGELTELVAELVDLATEVRDDEALEPVDLGELVAAVAARAERRTGRSIDVVVRRRGVVEGRPEALARAVRNLVDNAAKFSDDGPIEVVLDGGRVLVHDAGEGIPAEDRERVFDRFHRLERSRSRPGSGLGLAIVRQVAEAHGGRVLVEDSPTGGAAVGFEIPTVDG